MVKLIKWIGVSESFITWNTLFQGMKQSVSTVGTDLGTIEMKNEE